MRAELWARASELFENALDIGERERDAWLHARCDGDNELEAAVQRLLRADECAQNDDFLKKTIPESDPELLDDVAPDASAYATGSRVFGAYRLLRPIGQGGMGEVHLAERADGVFEQRVALKLLPHPTPGMMQRFSQERQILARMDHPNIARLFDGGIGEHGIPYFAMEYVEGAPINRFVTDSGLDVAQTLRLFLMVCDAVQYAHRNLIVHRDLKPSNILVTADGTPKLLDFGIAKLMLTTNDPDRSQTATRIFTPDYAAPEQLRGEPVTTATDVYSLGVVLYELLAGTKPYSFKRGSTLQQAIDLADVVAPSAMIGRSTNADPQRRRHLRGDVDRIVLTMLAKEPERRYGSVEALANDIRRFLDGRPIAARGENRAYRVRKFVRRNRFALASTFVVICALLMATAISLAQAQRANRQAQRADAVNGFLETIFRSIDPANAKGRDIRASELVDAGAARVDRDLADQPGAAAQLHATLGETYSALGDFAKAEIQFRAALRLFQPDQTARSIETMASLADLRLHSGAADEADALLDDAEKRASAEAPNDADLTDTLLGTRASFADERGDNVAALSLGEQRWRSSLQRLGDHAAATLDAEEAYASFLSGASRHAEAVTRQAHVVAQRRAMFGPDSPQLADALQNLGSFQAYLDKPEATLASFQEALDIRRKILATNHPDIARSLNATAEQLTSIGRAAEAIKLAQEADAVVRAQPQPDKLLLASVSNNWGVACHYSGDEDCAVVHLEEALALWQSIFRPDHTYILTARSSLAALLTGKGDLKAAEAQLREVQATRERDIAEHGDSEDKSDALHHTRELLSINLRYQNRIKESLQLARMNFSEVEARFPPPKIDHVEALTLLARTEAYAGELRSAQSHARAALTECDQLALGDVEPRAWSNLVIGYAALFDHDDRAAERDTRTALDIFVRSVGDNHPKTAEAHGVHARALAGLGEKELAKKELDSAIALLEAKQPWQPALVELKEARRRLF